MEKFQVIKMSYLVWSSQREMEPKPKPNQCIPPYVLPMCVWDIHTYTHIPAPKNDEVWKSHSSKSACSPPSKLPTHKAARRADLPLCHTAISSKLLPPPVRCESGNKMLYILPSPENPLE